MSGGNDGRQAPAASSAALRMRRHRERRRRKLQCLTIELRKREIDALVRKGILEAETRNNRQAIKLALYSFLDGTLGLTS
jgi:hypothetical protein